MQRHHVGIALSAALLIASGWYFLMSREAVAPIPDDAYGEPGEDAPDDAGSLTPPVSSMRIGEYAVYAPDQVPGSDVVIPLAALGTPGYVLVSAENGEELGRSPLLVEGEQTNIQISLSRETRDGEVLLASLHVDDGDGLYSSADLPALDPMGQPVGMRFTIAADADPPAQIEL